MQLDDLQAMAAIVSAVCAIVAATVSVLVWRKARAGDLSKQITKGDSDAKRHIDRSIDGVNQRLSTMDSRLGEVEDGVVRIEQQQAHTLTARDLGVVHEKINRVAEAIAANAATTNAMSEQLKTIQSYILRGSP